MAKTLSFVILAGFILASVHSAQAQPPTKIPRIGFLSTNSLSTVVARAEAFLQGLRELGYVKGKNIIIEYRYAEGNADRLLALAAELARLKVDLIVAGGATVTRTVKAATSTIPIVMAQVNDPVGNGFVANLARTGGDLTGFTAIAPTLAGKRLELLKEIVPELSRLAVLRDPHNPRSAQQWKESQLPARELGLQLHSIEVGSAEKFEAAFKEAAKTRSGALAIMASPFFYTNQKLLAELAIKNRLPAIYPREEFVAAGSLMSHGSDRAESFRRAAVFVDKILKGMKPADIPVEQPTKFELVINLKAAKQVGLMIPPNVLARADRVIR